VDLAAATVQTECTFLVAQLSISCVMLAISHSAAVQVQRPAQRLLRRASTHREVGYLKDLLLAAHNEELALITYDQATIPNTLNETGAEEVYHTGAIFVDSPAMPEFGTVARALIAL